MTIPFNFVINFTTNTAFGDYYDVEVKSADPMMTNPPINSQLGTFQLVSSGANGTTSFSSFADAKIYFYNLHKDNIVESANIHFGSTIYHAGAILDNIQSVDDAVNARQPLATTLTDLSGIAIAQDVLDMLGDPSGASGLATRVGNELALDTAAFHPATDFADAAATTTALNGKVDKILGKGLSTEDYTSGEKSKLGGIAVAATANSSDATLLNRANHTGTQSADTVVDGTTNKAYTAAEKTKLSGIATGATANDTDANLKNRANHTGTQLASTISDFTEAAQDAVGSMVSSEFNYNDAGNALSLRARSFNNSPSKTIQTVAAAANGFQLSTTRDAIVNYSVTVSNATQIGIVSNVTGYVVLEISPTNSTTAGDWVEIGRAGNGQNIGLAIALSLTTVTPGQIGGVIPAGYYARLRSVNTNGTPTYTYNSGQEVLL